MSSQAKLDKINLLNKSSLLEIGMNSIYNCSKIYHTVIQSPEFLRSELRLSNFKVINYDKIEEINLLNTARIIYGDYDRSKLYNREGVD